MNILFLTTHVNTGGISSYILTLGDALVKSGHKVFVASSGGNCEALLEAKEIKHIKINIRTKSEVHPKVWFCSGPLVQLIRKEKINIIHAQTRVTQVLGTFLGRLTGVPLITTCHGFFRPRWFRKTFPCWGKAVIAISKPVSEHLNKDFGVDPSIIHLIPNGIDLGHFVRFTETQRRSVRQEWGMGNEPLIGIVARLSDVKGIDQLIKAMPIIIKEIPSAKLMIIGQGPEENDLKSLSQELSLSGVVFFKSTTHESNKILGAFDVFVMPSVMEGLGLSVMEAQACGIPVVASRIGGLVDLIADGETGFLVPVKDPANLAVKIIQVLVNKEQSKQMAEQARLNIEQHYSASLMLKKTLEIYEQYSCC